MAAGRRNPIEHRRSSADIGVFFARQKQRGGLPRLLRMAGLSGQRSALAAPMRGFSTPFKPVSHIVESMGGGSHPA